MSCQQVQFPNGRCLVEITPHPDDSSTAAFTAFLSVVEDDGAIVRPLVSGDGHRVRIRATTEPLALDSAISYLAERFGRPNQPDQGCALGMATVGSPIVVKD